MAEGAVLADSGNDIQRVRALNNLGGVHAQRGEFTAALTAHEQATMLATRVSGADDPLVSDSLDGQALALIQLERFHDAESILERSRAIRTTSAASAPRALASTLSLIAVLHRQAGSYAQAMPAAEQALSLWREYAPDHPGAARAEQVVGDLRFLAGDVAAARDAWQLGLAHAEKRLRPDHPTVARFLRTLALAASASGDLTDARALLERARRIGAREFADCDPETPGLLNDLASLVEYDGDYPAAQTGFAKALAVRERCLGATHSLVANIVYNQGVLATDTGDLAEGQRLHQKAVRVWTASLGPNHPYVAKGLDALADVMMARGQFAPAARLYQQALAIRRRSLGPTHPDVAWTLASLARVATARGDLAGARTDLAEADRIYREGGTSQEPDHLARIVLMRGALEMREGDVRAARASFADALGMRERIFGASHPLSAEARASVASADFALGTFAGAIDNALEAERVGREHLQYTARYLPDRQAMAYASKRPHGLDLALSAIAGSHTTDAAPIADAMVRSRGVVLDELAARAHARATSDPAVSALNASLLAARQRFANLMLRSLRGEDAVAPNVLDAARRDKESAERASADNTAAGSLDRAVTNAGLADVQRALPDASALVSFARYERTPDARGRMEPSYLAFVIKPGTSGVVTVPLGPARSIDDLVEAWREEARGAHLARMSSRAAEDAYRDAAVRLRRRIWDAVAGQLTGVSQVFIVPDGAINFVSLAALPANNGKYLIESGPTIHYLTAERDLLVSKDSERGEGLLAVGGAAFDDVPRVAVAAATRALPCRTAGALSFADLPGTLGEIRDVADIWNAGRPAPRRTDAADGVTTLSGARATERATTAALSHRRVVHLATHGFFLPAACSHSAVSNTRAVGGVVSGALAPGMSDANPLVLAGLALAGANNSARRPPADDGILTAEEVASLDMRGTEWAVLSACDTGLGEIAVGEGVVGLRRAFHIAGVQTVIMSLWSVEDQSARLWMRELYQARFRRQLSTSDAMREASLRVLAARRARGESSHPFYWAAFVAVGNWR